MVFQVCQQVDVHNATIPFSHIGQRIKCQRSFRIYAGNFVPVVAFCVEFHVLAHHHAGIQLELTVIALNLGFKGVSRLVQGTATFQFNDGHFGAIDKRSFLRIAANPFQRSSHFFGIQDNIVIF